MLPKRAIFSGKQMDFLSCLSSRNARFCSKQRAQLIRVVVYFVEQTSQDCFPASKWNSMRSIKRRRPDDSLK